MPPLVISRHLSVPAPNTGEVKREVGDAWLLCQQDKSDAAPATVIESTTIGMPLYAGMGRRLSKGMIFPLLISPETGRQVNQALRWAMTG